LLCKMFKLDPFFPPAFYLHFARTRRRHPMEVGAACAAAGAAGLHLAGYNRANYFENLHLKQSRNYRKQQIVHSQADLFRADVEQAIGASSAVQDRLIVVSALLLGVTAHTNGWNLPANTRSFLQDMFYLCIGNAFLYFLVSLIASISANILARKCQKELLNNCVRPPFAEMMRDVDLAAELESAEAFERQGVSQVLRIPGADQLSPQNDKLSQEIWTESSTGSASMSRLIQQQISNELTLMEMQHDWDELQTYTPYFLVWGLRSLLNSFGFFSLAHTYRAQKPYGFQVHIFYVIIVAGLSFISERLMATSRRVFAVELGALILCHVLCFCVACQDRNQLADSQQLKFESFNVSILVAYGAQLVTVAIAQFRFAANAQNLEPTRGGMPPHEISDWGCYPNPTRQDSNFSLTSNEWSMAPELVSTFRSEQSDLKSMKLSRDQNDVLNQRWQHLSFVRVYVRKFCIFAGWAVIAVWLGAVIFQTGRVVTSTRRTEMEDPLKTRRLDLMQGAGTDDAVTVSIEMDGKRQLLRDLKTKTVAELLETSNVAPLTFWQRLQGKRVAVRQEGIELSGLLTLESLGEHELSVHVEDPL